MTHSPVVCWREQKANSQLVDAAGYRIRRKVQPHASRLEHIRAAAAAGYGAIAMLGHPPSGGRHHKGHGGGHIEQAASVSPRSTGVNQVARVGHRDRGGQFAHDPGRGGDFSDRLALHPQTHQQAANLGGGCVAGHDGVHDQRHLGIGEILAGDQPGNGLRQIHVAHCQAARAGRSDSRKFRSKA